MNIITTSKGAYLASLLAGLPNIDSIDKYQNLGLNVLRFDQQGMPYQLNTLTEVILELYTHVKKLHLVRCCFLMQRSHILSIFLLQ